VLDSALLSVNGTLNWTGSDINAKNLSGIDVSGTFNISTDKQLNNGNATLPNTGTLHVFTDGVLRRNGGPAGATDLLLKVMNAGGTVTLDNLNPKMTYLQTAGTTSLSGQSHVQGFIWQDVINPGGYLVNVSFEIDGGTFEMNNGTLTLDPGKGMLNEGRMTGTGSVVGSVENRGQIDVGGAGSVGTLRIDGSLYCVNGSLNFEIGGATPGTGYDQLIVTGLLLADGAVTGTQTNSYQFNVNETFDLVTYGAYTGQFATSFADPGTGLMINAGFVPTNPNDPTGAGVFQAVVLPE
jgi:hypothetical protein